MEQTKVLSFDMHSFQICQLCFRLFFILALEVYLLFLYVRQMIQLQNSNYDKLDISFFTVSILCLSTDIVTTLMFGIGISSFGLLLKIIWSLVLFLILLRFIFRKQECIKYFAAILISLLLYHLYSIYFNNIIPIRYSLMLLFLSIIACCLYHFLCINQLINYEKARQKELKLSLQQQKVNQSQLLINNKSYQYAVLSSDVKYHLYLRRSFCIVMGLSLAFSYFLLWNLQESRNSLGQFFVIVVIELLPIMVYYFFTCVNQWLIQQINNEQVQQNKEPNQDIQLTNLNLNLSHT